jgi:beta-lactam-binding protein with PASTA domain/tRNA A-37 threonylcarbamoyl transferase component Bud32
MNDQHRDPDAAGVPTLLAGRYRIISPLGSGGMADVYLAEDERLSRRVAVKVLKARLAADDEFVERFRIEAQAAASLNHPSIVAVYDRGSADGVTYIAMEYVAGESLKQRLRRDGVFPPDEAVAVALAVLSALGAAHARHIVHRDVTSYNVMLAEDGRVVVTDFGIARMGDSALTRTGAMMGTSSYLSPEQAQGRPADERSDLYSLGVVLYEMLTGRVPFKGESDVAVALQHVQAAPPNPRTLTPAVSEALAATVMRALSKDPSDRFQDTEEFAAALRKARRPARNDRGASVAVGEGAGHGTLAAAGVAAAAGAGAAAGASVLGAVAAPPAPVPATFTSASGAPAPPAAAPPAPAPSAAGAEPLVTVVAAEAATRYHSAEPATTVRPRPRRRIRRYLLLALLVLVVAAAGWVAYITWLAPGTTVPSLVGERRADAVQALRDEGLDPALHYVWADRYAEGEVARQAPRGGQRVDDGVKVDLWVSRGPLHLPAPDLSGSTATAAKDTLEGASLTYKSHRSASESVPKGQVFRQKPAAGKTVQRGDTVTFWVSSGPPKVYVPDVVGLSQGDAQAQLEAEGFVVSVDYVAGWGEMPGDVVGQDPVAGTKGRAGDEIVIQVAVF